MAAGCSAFLFAIVAIVALVVSIQTLQRAKQAREEAGQLRTALDALARRVGELRGRAPQQPCSAG